VKNGLKIFFPDDISLNIKFGEMDNITKDGNLAKMTNSWSMYQETLLASYDYLARFIF
jgi:hypothetical protein